MNNSISFYELNKISNPNIIDIRSKNQYIQGHVKGAIPISEYDLLFDASKYLQKGVRYYIYCDYGNRSERVVLNLRQMGFDAVNIEGGYNNYLFQ